MQNYINHIESQLANEKDNPLLYEFKKQILDNMTSRANELTHAGLNDEKVLSDLIIDEHSNLKAEYKKFVAQKTEKKRKRRFAIYNILGSVMLILSSVIIYLTVSFSTKAWGQTWLIMDGVASLWIVFEFSLLIKKLTKSAKTIFHPAARTLLATNVMIITHFVFLIYLVVLHIPKSWLIFILGVIIMFATDGIYVAMSKQRLAILNYLFYILASSPMVYIILSALGITAWSKGWIIIPIALLIDIVIIAIKLIVRQFKLKYEEVE